MTHQYSRVVVGIALWLVVSGKAQGDAIKGDQSTKPALLVDFGEPKPVPKRHGETLVPGRAPLETPVHAPVQPLAAYLEKLGGIAPALTVPKAVVGSELEEALNDALAVVGKSHSEELHKILESFEPQYMLAGGTSQAKDSLMMMLMGLPFAFQAKGVGTRVPVLYRIVKSKPNTTMEVNMRFKDGRSEDGDVDPEDVVDRIEQHMEKYAKLTRDGSFGEESIDITISGPNVQQALYKNMMGRVQGKDKKAIDDIYKVHAENLNVNLIAVERAQTGADNSMIIPFVNETDPMGKRTIWVKTWADFGISEWSADSGRKCEEVQDYFKSMDFTKFGPAPAKTFWIATVEEGDYLQNQDLTFDLRRVELEERIRKKEAKMQAFLDRWKEKGCRFDFEEHVKVTKLRKHLSERHTEEVTQKMPEIIAALERAKESIDEELQGLKDRLDQMGGEYSNSSQILRLIMLYKDLSDEQMMGERSPPAEGLSFSEVQKIQEGEEGELKMSATGMAIAMKKDIKYDDAGQPFDDAGQLEEVAGLLRYTPANQKLSITGHHWHHLTNMFILLARKLGDKDHGGWTEDGWTEDDSAVGFGGSSACWSAARQGRHFVGKLFGSDVPLKRLMVSGIKWLLKKHQKVVRKLLMEMPRNSAFKSDGALNAEMDRVDERILNRFVKDFTATFDMQAEKAGWNLQQSKIRQMLLEQGQSKNGSQTYSKFIAELAEILDSDPKDCKTVYKDIIESGVNDMVMAIGTWMYNALYGIRGGMFLKNTEFVAEMTQELIGSRSNDDLPKFFTSLGERQRLLKTITKMNSSAADIDRALELFTEASSANQMLVEA